MIITKQVVAGKLLAYLRHEIKLPQLVNWAEATMMDGHFDASAGPELVAAVARLGTADVRTFKLTLDDCEEILRSLGYPYLKETKGAD